MKILVDDGWKQVRDGQWLPPWAKPGEVPWSTKDAVDAADGERREAERTKPLSQIVREDRDTGW